MNKGINLFKTEKKISVAVASQKLTVLRLVAIGLLFCTSAFSIILFLLIVLSPLPDLQKQEKTLLATISGSHPDIAKLFLINDRLKSSETIIDKRQNFDKSLSLIKQRMSSDVSITAITMNKSTISITVSSSSLSSLDNFLNSLVDAVDSKKDFSKVTMTNFLADEVRDNFFLTIEVATL